MSSSDGSDDDGGWFPGQPKKRHDIDDPELEHSRGLLAGTTYLMRLADGALFEKDRRATGRAIHHAIEVAIGESTVESFPCPHLQAIDDIFDRAKDKQEQLENIDLDEIVPCVLRNVHKACLAVSQSVTSQLGVEVSYSRLTALVTAHSVRAQVLAHIKDGLLERYRQKWLSQLCLEFDLVCEALDQCLAETKKDATLTQLVVRLPRLGSVYTNPTKMEAGNKNPQLVIVDWISFPAGSQWVGLNFNRGDEPAQPLSPDIMQTNGHASEVPLVSLCEGQDPSRIEASGEPGREILPQELLDKCIDTDQELPYLHVYLKSKKEPDTPNAGQGCRQPNICLSYPEDETERFIGHEYRIGYIKASKPVWCLRKNLRDDAVSNATPKPLDPEKPEYIFEMLNNRGKFDIENLDQGRLLTVAEEALHSTSHLIVLDGEEDLSIGCLRCFYRAIWETGAFAAGARTRRVRGPLRNEYYSQNPDRHTHTRGGQKFLMDEPFVDWVSIMKSMTIVITPRLKRAYENTKSACGSRYICGGVHIPHLDEDITDFVSHMRDVFDPCHMKDKHSSHPLQHILFQSGESTVGLNDADLPMFEEEQAVFLMQGKRPLGSSKLGGTEAETKSYLPARPGLFFNTMFPLEGPIQVNRPENGYRTILADVDMGVFFANCQMALTLLARLSSQPWSSITDAESRLLCAILDTKAPCVDFARSLRYLRTDPQASIAVFFDASRTPPCTPADSTPPFFSGSVMNDQYAIKAEEQHSVFLNKFFKESYNPVNMTGPPRVPHFPIQDYLVDYRDCVETNREVKLDLHTVKCNAARKGLFPLYRQAVLQKLDMCRWLAAGKQDHLIFFRKPAPESLNANADESWNGHHHRAIYAFMSHHIDSALLVFGDHFEMLVEYEDHVRMRQRQPLSEYWFGHVSAEYTRVLYDKELEDACDWADLDGEDFSG